MIALLPAYGSSFAAAVGGALLRIALDDFSVSINRDNAQLVELQIEADRREIRLAEIDRRQLTLRESVIPMLRRLAAGDNLTAADRHHCQIMEQTARDQLVAPSVVASPTMADAVFRARSRGATVLLSDEDPAAGDNGFRIFQELLLAVIETMVTGAVVRARWRPRGATLGTIVIVGANPSEEDLARWQRAGDFGDEVRVKLSLDEDSILLELVVEWPEW